MIAAGVQTMIATIAIRMVVTFKSVGRKNEMKVDSKQAKKKCKHLWEMFYFKQAQVIGGILLRSYAVFFCKHCLATKSVFPEDNLI